MRERYSINTLSKLTNVTIRTLHYYDEINLLSPTHRNNSGHRFYTRNDWLTLQQIITLKFLGLSLKQIKKIIQGKNLNIRESIKIQAKALSDKAVLMTNIVGYLNTIISDLDDEQSINWNVIATTIQALQTKNNDAKIWYEKYFTVDENKKLAKVIKTRTDQWLKLFSEVKNNLHTKPTSQYAKKLIKKLFTLANKAYGTQPELITKLWEGYKAGMIPVDFFPRDQAVIIYLSKAFEHFKQINLLEKNNDPFNKKQDGFDNCSNACRIG